MQRHGNQFTYLIDKGAIRRKQATGTFALDLSKIRLAVFVIWT